jgi:shikimate kinase
MNVVLIGYRCSGKTLVGKMLARELGRDFWDTDRLIEMETGASVPGLVSSKGWDYFRDVERKVIEVVARKDNVVIATGGGVVMEGANMEHLKRNGWIVWLNTDAGVIEERMGQEEMSGTARPALTGSNPVEEIERVLRVRTPLYAQAADLAVDTSRRSPGQVTEMIMHAFVKQARKG